MSKASLFGLFQVFWH